MILLTKDTITLIILITIIAGMFATVINGLILLCFYYYGCYEDAAIAMLIMALTRDMITMVLGRLVLKKQLRFS